MELLINLSKDIDGKEYNNIKPKENQETSKIQKILQKIENNYNININEEEDEQTIDNNNNNININDNKDFNDIDGEPL